MCGIAGIFRFDSEPVDPALLAEMTGLLAHRGPDDERFWAAGPVGFGHRRLSIIDLSGSAQPMASADGRHHICFNGEILNYRRLREQTSYPFHTNGDTEVALARFVTRGVDGLSDLAGQFAFAVHDAERNQLYLVRDRIGILPLYYHLDGGRLVFASEIKAILPALSGPPRVDHASVADYLAARSVPAPRTLFEGIRKLLPGHVLVVTGDGRISTRRYWRPPTPADMLTVGPEEAVDLVDETLRRAVERATVADTPVGAYLSGGLDSSLVAALMTRQTAEPVHTFSVGFGSGPFDELPIARSVSARLGTRHHELEVGPNDFSDLWHTATWHRDAPVSEPADVAVHMLARLAREQVRVVLSGEGADELFGGYPKYRLAALTSRIGAIPAWMRGPVFDRAQQALPAGAHRLRIALRALGEPDERARREGWFAPFTERERMRLLGRPRFEHGRLLPATDSDPLRGMLEADLLGWLPDNLLERGDRMTMAASVEMRPPMLDHELVELAFRLPSAVKVRDGRGKWVLKEVARRYLPDEIVDRPKVGFRVPIGEWFRGGLSELARDMLTGGGSFVGDLLGRPAVRRMLDMHESGRRNEEIRIWTLLCLEVWHEVFFRQATPGNGGNSRSWVGGTGARGNAQFWRA
ncbi:asparagine synthase (glutamine-hydrolyzing) [Pseudofrankia asymbiotica]|uniref:asparagine synthase (glutamine-hydrolyzing) n=1 Tax=Pseudofrankia asymbiotica TaxID=1834516 RepID=A0A1V2I939_9ACTN|nr:asparagine synthase (glutamine-hydrolyzing) [Pseudofrankia asymbiotica]ONH28973.1 asparagine synthase (glutamine-hydrolyzing) [Pseudofrankia asymbiotica]